MDTPIQPITAEHIALRAEQDALAQLTSGAPAKCAYPEGSREASIWGTALARYLKLHSAAEGTEGDSA